MPIWKETKRPPWLLPKEKVAFSKEAWRAALYKTHRWAKLAKAEINNEPMCAICALNGVVTTENLERDHVNGFANEDEFWDGPRQTLCRRHNRMKAGSAGGKKSRG